MYGTILGCSRLDYGLEAILSQPPSRKTGINTSVLCTMVHAPFELTSRGTVTVTATVSQLLT